MVRAGKRAQVGTASPSPKPRWHCPRWTLEGGRPAGVPPGLALPSAFAVPPCHRGGVLGQPCLQESAQRDCLPRGTVCPEGLAVHELIEAPLPCGRGAHGKGAEDLPQRPHACIVTTGTTGRWGEGQKLKEMWQLPGGRPMQSLGPPPPPLGLAWHRPGSADRGASERVPAPVAPARSSSPEPGPGR